MLPSLQFFFFFGRFHPYSPHQDHQELDMMLPLFVMIMPLFFALIISLFSLNSRLNCTSSGNPFLNPQTQLCYFDTGSHHTMDFSFLTISVPIVSICNYLLILKPPLSQDLCKWLSSSEAQC